MTEQKPDQPMEKQTERRAAGAPASEPVVITQGRYIASAVRKDQYPERELPEIVFIGRSNVGKSSLINSLTRIRGLARVSAQPGKTQTINFYNVSCATRRPAKKKAARTSTSSTCRATATPRRARSAARSGRSSSTSTC